jgi:FAD:protein FMN transferase
MATSIDVDAEHGRIAISGALYHGIPCRILIVGDRSIAEAGWAILRRIDDVFNVHRSDSELGHINTLSPGTHQVSKWLADCLRIARDFETLSEHAWSATMLPLVRIWRLAASSGARPDPRALQHAVSLTRDTWHIDDDRLTVTEAGTAFDLGGLAKGFAVDLVVAHLHEYGVHDFLVQVGGETACHGSSPHGGRHRIGIPHPDDPDDSWCALLQDPGAGLCGSTSGDYRLGIDTVDGRRHHILDPRSGQPVTTGATSITCVFTGLGHNALADAVTTSVAVSGIPSLSALCTRLGCAGFALRRDPERGLLASKTPNWQALLADDSP